MPTQDELRILFEEQEEFMQEYRVKKEKAAKKVWEAKQWLIKHGVLEDLIDRLIANDKLTLATIDDAKRQYSLSLIHI